jgi:hypothetical protein
MYPLDKVAVSMSLKRVLSLILFILLISCTSANAAEKTEKDWLSRFLKWDAWNTPYSKTQNVAGMTVIATSDEADEILCKRKKESLKSLAPNLRITDVSYGYFDVYTNGNNTGKWLIYVILTVNDEDTYVDEYSDVGVVGMKFEDIIGKPCDDIINASGEIIWYWKHNVKLDHLGIVEETVSIKYVNDDGDTNMVIMFQIELDGMD